MEDTAFIPTDTVPTVLQWWHDFEEFHKETSVIFISLSPFEEGGTPNALGVSIKILPYLSLETEKDLQVLIDRNYVPVGFIGLPNDAHESVGNPKSYCGTLLPNLEGEAPGNVLKMLETILDSVLRAMDAKAKPLTSDQLRKMDS